MHGQAVDGGRLYFDPETGTNVLIRSPVTATLRRSAPRSLQIGLLTPCNLACDFCYRDTSAPSRLTKPFLLDLLIQAAEWGVLEVAFGGGEPLLFDDFAGLLRELHANTPLGLNFTTNGTLLTQAFLDDVDDAVGEIRVSAYADNHYRRTLRLLSGREFGVNWLVTPENVGLVEPVVHDCLALGARNVLLLGYKGADASLHLRPEHLHVLSQTLRRRTDWPILLDICWHPLLEGVPQLFARSDCGAGDEFLVITPDRAVQPCSFHHERIPFETFSDLQVIHADLRARRASACIDGCTRASFVERPQPAGVFVWKVRASNNSGTYTVLGRFATTDEAVCTAVSLEEVAQAHVQWLQTHPDFERYDAKSEHVPATPPLLEFGRAHGFAWDEGLWWECDDGHDMQSFSAHVIDNTVIIHHPYAMGSGWRNFEKFFAAVGAKAAGWCDVSRVKVAVEAIGDGAAFEKIERHAEIIRAPDYALDAEPPWGKEAVDPRFGEDEDRNAEAAYGGDCTVERTAHGIKLLVAFENPFAGAVAVECWLRDEGFRDIIVSLDSYLGDVEPGATIAPKTGLFGDVRSHTEQAADADEAELARLAFEYGPEHVERVAEIDKERLVELWEPLGRDIAFGLALERAAYTGSRRWLDRIWSQVMASDDEGDYCFPRALREALTQDETVARMRDFLDAAGTRKLRGKRLQSCEFLEDARVLDWIEEFEPTNDLFEIATVATCCGITWDRIQRWFEGGAVELAGWCIYALDDDDLPNDAASLIRKIRRQVREPLKGHLRFTLDELPKPWWRFW